MLIKEKRVQLIKKTISRSSVTGSKKTSLCYSKVKGDNQKVAGPTQTMLWFHHWMVRQQLLMHGFIGSRSALMIFLNNAFFGGIWLLDYNFNKKSSCNFGHSFCSLHLSLRVYPTVLFPKQLLNSIILNPHQDIINLLILFSSVMLKFA